MIFRKTLLRYLTIATITIVFVVICHISNYDLEGLSSPTSSPLMDQIEFTSSFKTTELLRESYNMELEPKKINNVYTTEPTWVQIDPNLYIYSSFWESRKSLTDSPFVRSIAIFRYNDSHLVKEKDIKWTGIIKKEALPYDCYLWYEGLAAPIEGNVTGFVYEEALKSFVGIFLNCHLNETSKEKNVSTIPYAVSFLPRYSSNFPHKLIYLHSGNKQLLNYSVCVRSLFGPFDDIKLLSEFIIYYKSILKVDRFYFYDFSITQRTRMLLRTFASNGVDIQILRWNLPTGSWDELWDLGSLSVLNECVYRTMGISKYTIIVDVDEFIIPTTGTDSISEIYLKTLKHKKGSIGDAVLPLNAFFCDDFKKNINVRRPNHSMKIFKYIVRETRLWNVGDRSKLITTPDTVISLGHHMVHKFINSSYQNRAIPKSVGMLNHYRTCKDLKYGIYGNGALVINSQLKKDISALKFRKSVMESPLYKIYKNNVMIDLRENG